LPLFQEGRALMAEGRIPEACLKLEESQRIDSGGGTLLNLALCHEREGRLARAWSEFKEAELVARADSRRAAEVEAANHVGALEPRLSRLTIVVSASAQVEGLVVERDGRVVGRGAWSTAIPVDAGAHIVRATAPGREPFSATVVMAPESDARTVEIPVLATPIVAVPPTRAALPPVPAPPVPPLLTRTRLRQAGIASAGFGVILLGAAGYALATAISASNASNAHCYVDGCDDIGVMKRRIAASRGDLATLLGVGGVILVGVGATSYTLGRRSSTPAQGQGTVATRLVVTGAPGIVVAGIVGAFW
jgi:hypothetical protein